MSIQRETRIPMRSLKAMARNLECTIRRVYGTDEFRVNWIGASESVAYYTNSDLDALRTMEEMKRGLDNARSHMV